MSYKTPEHGYGIETVADAVFTLQQSTDVNDLDMAINPHSYTPTVIIRAARRIAKANIAMLAARSAAPSFVNECPF